MQYTVKKDGQLANKQQVCIIIPVLSWLLLMLLFALSPVYAQGPDSPMPMLTAYLDELQSYSADFSQTVYGQGDRVLETSTGQVYLLRPGKFHWQYEEPYSQYLISDGDTLWVYDEDLEQLTISSLGNRLQQTPASILTGDVDIESRFSVESAGSKDGYEWIELLSRDAEVEFNSLQLGFYDGELAAMVLFDNLGQQTRLEFSNIVRNRTLENELFGFIAPEGIDIIDTRE